MAFKRPALTAEQLALSEARKAKKAKQNGPLAPTTASLVNEVKGRIAERKWIQIKRPDEALNDHRVKVFTWNLLAQCLVRRELFPNSNCLKATQREHMLYREILMQDADILCLQALDRLEKLVPVIESANYAHRYAAGPNKKHGCLIAFKQDYYEEVGSKLILYDEQKVRDQEGINSCGGTFRTRNIGHIVALKHKQRNEGVVVATTHLFWHPKYVYEKARQAAILKREVVQFKHSIGHDDWPCIISGDFNFTPDDPVYSLVIGDPILPAQEERLLPSYVIHSTIDPSIAAVTNKTSNDENEEAEAADPDKVITNARPAQLTDGLLSLSELQAMFTQSGPSLKSAYDNGLRGYLDSPGTTKPTRTFGDRVNVPSSRRGGYELEWSSYTFYWKLTLDYIFILDAPGGHSTITGLLSGHRTEDLDPGLPQLGVCGSDHVSLSAEIVFAHS
ncbi:Endonuclease/exonuclease/phosphatase [Lentinula raphanica]|uniref:Endonuclease/exonuclease/phosphatase n=1 Tax=Lentinula raphanica TaxID=153919 RepID=A0AA38PL18_9AGAR|nr:Endonuclease/exonuclease/phosphatase [Lentinula raphanica]